MAEEKDIFDEVFGEDEEKEAARKARLAEAQAAGGKAKEAGDSEARKDEGQGEESNEPGEDEGTGEEGNESEKNVAGKEGLGKEGPEEEEAPSDEGEGDSEEEESEEESGKAHEGEKAGQAAKKRALKEKKALKGAGKRRKKAGTRIVTAPVEKPLLAEKIRKIVVAKAVKAAEKDVVPPDVEVGTREVGVKEGDAIEAAGEQAAVAQAGPFVKPELKFLQDDKGDAFIGRKKSVFQKYGDEAALFVGKVNEKDLMDTNICLDSLNPHVVFVCGARGSGKCLHGDTLIPLDDGRTIPIREFEGEHAKVCALDHNLKVKQADRIAFSRRTVGKILWIRLRTGKEIKLTPEHPLLTVNGWMQACELGAGSRIATPRALNNFGKTRMKECDVKLLAYLIAEGHLSNQFVLFSNNDPKIVEDFKESVLEFDSGLRIEQHSKPSCFRVVQRKKKMNLEQVVRNEKGQFTSKGFVIAQKSSLMQFMESIGLYGKLSKDKFIPQEVMQLEKEQLALFLNRLFSCDGSIYRISKGKSWGACYASASRRIAEQVQHLLLRFGIISVLRDKEVKFGGRLFEAFEVVMYRDGLAKFIAEIGFFGEKESKQEKAVEDFFRLGKNPNVDTIPKDIRGMYRPKNWKATARELGYAPKSFHNTVNYAPSREKMLKIALVDQNKGIQMLAQSDIFWDEITKVENIFEETDVYDIEVPNFHNFVANDIIVHNSYVLGVIAEELAMKNKNVGVIVVDPVGVFWGMKHPNRETREIEALAKWNLLPQGLENLRVFIPEGIANQVPKSTYDATFSMPPSLLTTEDWCLTFGIERFSPSGLLMEKGLEKVKKGYKNKEGKSVKGKKNLFSLEDLIQCLYTDEDLNSGERGYKADSIRALVSRFDAAKSWGVFNSMGTPLVELSREGQLTVIDTSFLEDNVSALVIGILARRILAARKVSTRRESAGRFGKEENVDHLLEFGVPPTWLFIDEAHTLIPSGNVMTPASSALIEYVKQGRQPGCSLVFATQQPSAINTKVLSQLDVVIAHKLVFDDDVKAVYKRVPTIVPKAYKKSNFIKTLPVGIALIGDRREETSRAFIMKIRPRMSQHEGREAETAEGDLKLDDEKVLLLAVEMAKGKLDQVGSLSTGTIAQVVETLNAKYRSKIKLGTVLERLEEDGAVINEGTSTISIPGEVQEEALAEELVGEAEKEVEKEAKAVFPEEAIELLAFPVSLDAEKARLMFNRMRRRKLLGIFGEEEAIENIQLRYLPIYRVEYNAFDTKQTFRKAEAFVNSISGEFIHFDGKKKGFVESQGLQLLDKLSNNELKLLMMLDRKREFAAIAKEFEESKESTAMAKRLLQSLEEKGFVAKEKVSGTEFYARAKPVELPLSPTHQLLGSLSGIPVLNIAAMSLMREAVDRQKLAKSLAKLWGNIVVKKIELVYLPVYETFLRKKDGSIRKIFIEAVTGNQFRLGDKK